MIKWQDCIFFIYILGYLDYRMLLFLREIPEGTISCLCITSSCNFCSRCRRSGG